MVRDKTQISIFVVGAMLIADFIWFGYIPSQKRLSALQQSRSRQLQVIETANAKRAQLPGMRKTLHMYERSAASHERQIPEQKDIGRFLQDMSACMTRHGIQRQMIVPGSEHAAEVVKFMPVTVHGCGRLTQFFAFFQDVQAMTRLVRIRTVHFDNDPAYEGRLTMESELVIYYQLNVSPEDRELASLL